LVLQYVIYFAVIVVPRLLLIESQRYINLVD
jgi:hypothetical protein